jgi:glycosyltransferase involved in cell wall biosynthesis
MKDRPLVSVCVTAFQHGPYIRECLESIVRQDTNFPFELLIGEDESSDDTANICKEYAQNYPDTVRLFLNQRRDVVSQCGIPTGKANFINNLRHARGKYLAFCDGDDFWASQEKIQRQVDALERTGAVLCCHPAGVLGGEGRLEDTIGFHGCEELLLEKEVVFSMLRYRSVAPMPSIMVNKEILLNLPEFLLRFPGGAHGYMQLFSAAAGTFAYLPDSMAVYRRGVEGSMTEKMRSTKTRVPIRIGKAEGIYCFANNNIYDPIVKNYLFEMAGFILIQCMLSSRIRAKEKVSALRFFLRKNNFLSALTLAFKYISARLGFRTGV